MFLILAMYSERCAEVGSPKCVGGYKWHNVIDLDNKGCCDKASLTKTIKLVKLVSVCYGSSIYVFVKER